MSGCDLGCGVGEQLTQLSQQISDCHADVCVVKASQLSVKEAVRLHDMELQGRSV